MEDYCHESNFTQGYTVYTYIFCLVKKQYYIYSYPITLLCTAKFKRILFIFSRLGLSLPAKQGLERSVRTTSFSTVH